MHSHLARICRSAAYSGDEDALVAQGMDSEEDDFEAGQALPGGRAGNDLEASDVDDDSNNSALFDAADEALACKNHAGAGSQDNRMEDGLEDEDLEEDVA